MYTALLIIHIIASILLCISIMLQSKGSGLSAVFGGGGEFHATKRGAEKFLHNATIVLTGLFVLIAVVLSMLTK